MGRYFGNWHRKVSIRMGFWEAQRVVVTGGGRFLGSFVVENRRVYPRTGQPSGTRAVMTWCDQKVFIADCRNARRDFGWSRTVDRDAGIRSRLEWSRTVVDHIRQART